MIQHPTVEGHIIDLVRKANVCGLEEIMQECPELTWNQVFFAVDGLSRSGEIILVCRGRGMYAVKCPPTAGRSVC